MKVLFYQVRIQHFGDKINVFVYIILVQEKNNFPLLFMKQVKKKSKVNIASDPE